MARTYKYHVELDEGDWGDEMDECDFADPGGNSSRDGRQSSESPMPNMRRAKPTDAS